MASSFMDCMRRFSQIILIITNIFISLLGLAVMIIGIWANVDGKNYVTITDNTSQFTEVSVLAIVVGLFVMLMGGVGVAGAIFASTICGRVTLGLYGVVLAILVICEISGGIAAAAKKDSLQNAFTDSANTNFMLYNNDTNKRDAWDKFQEGFHCCGVNGSKDYVHIFPNGTIPSSCCKPDLTSERCDSERNIGSNSSEIFQEGCVQRVIDGFKGNLGAIAGGAIVLGLVQIFGVVMACFVALYKRDDTKYEVV